MPNVNLASVGFNVVVPLEGTVTVREGQQPLIVLLADCHNNNDIIGQNLRSALNLIDAGIVRLVGVEQYTPIEIKAGMAQEIPVRSAGPIAAYGQSIREQHGRTDDGGIAA